MKQWKTSIVALLLVLLVCFCMSAIAESCNHTNTTTVTQKTENCTAVTTNTKVICLDCSAVVSDKTETTAGSHAYGEGKVVKSITCTEGGQIDYTCSKCGDVKSETFPAAGHTAGELKATTEATCETAGYNQYQCATCGEIYKVAIPATGHNYALTTAKEPTCAADGYKAWLCTVCGKEQAGVDRTVIPATGEHKEVYDKAQSVAATCTTDGKDVYVCEACHKVLATYPVAKTGHNYVKDAKQSTEATCTAEGKTVEVCANCKDVKTTPVKKLAHTPAGAALTVKPSTCTEAGYEQYECSVCHQGYTKTLDLLDHSYDWKVVVKATCATNKDEMAHICTICGAEHNIDHKFVENVIDHKPVKDDSLTIKATCEKDGKEFQVCENCGKVFDLAVLPATGHSPVLEESMTIKPTCEEAGKNFYRCQYCKEIVSEEVVPATGHAPKEDYEIKKATCTEAGEKGTVCLFCGKVFKSEKVPALGHDYQVVAAKDNGCGVEGHSEYYQCSVCKAEDPTRAKEVWAALTHNFEKSVIDAFVEPTCTVDGYQVMACTTVSHEGVQCTETEKKVLPAVGHKHGVIWHVVYEATCTHPGQEVNRCYLCYLDEQYREIPQKAHEYPTAKEVSADNSKVGVYGAMIKQPTCTEAGSARVTCKNCMNTTVIELPALGHTMGAWKLDEGHTTPTCTADMTGTRTCSKCDYAEHKTYVAAYGHKWVETKDSVAPTCTEAGKVYGVCDICGEKAEGKVVPATGHNYVATTTPASCGVAGKIVNTCSACGDTKTETIPALSHAFDNGLVKTAATCTTEGEKVYTCNNCGLTKSETIAKLAHSYKTVIVREATVNANGVKVDRCTVCGAETNETTIKYDKIAYNYTITAEGIALKEFDRAITSNAKAIVVDLTKDGTYSYNLVASNMYVVGQVNITVSNGKIIITSTNNALKVKGAITLFTSIDDIIANNGIEVNENEVIDAGNSDIAFIVIDMQGNVDTGDYRVKLYKENNAVAEAMKDIIG